MPAKRTLSLRPRNWWQAGLAWGTAMFVYYAAGAAFSGQLTPGWAARGFVVWEAGGLAFGLLLTALLSLVYHKNLFTGFGNGRQGER